MDGFHEAIAAARGLVSQAVTIIDHARLLTPQQSTLVMGAVVFGIALPAAAMWLTVRPMRPLRVAVVSCMPVAAILLLLQVPQGLAGAPDDRCRDYGGGKLVFSLLGFYVSRPSVYAETPSTRTVILLVSAPRWGLDPHQCRLPLSDPVVDKLLQKITAARDAGELDSDGALTFTFGDGDEEPNVTVHAQKPEGKTSPPEVPPQSRHGI